MLNEFVLLDRLEFLTPYNNSYPYTFLFVKRGFLSHCTILQSLKSTPNQSYHMGCEWFLYRQDSLVIPWQKLLPLPVPDKSRYVF